MSKGTEIILGLGILAGIAYLIRPAKAQPYISTASYTIIGNNGIIQAINGKTGNIDFSGNDATTVITDAINNLPEGRWIAGSTFKPLVAINGFFTVRSIDLASMMTLQIIGGLKLADNTNGNLLNVPGDVEVFGGVLNGNKTNNINSDIIHIEGWGLNYIHNIKIEDAALNGVNVVNSGGMGRIEDLIIIDSNQNNLSIQNTNDWHITGVDMGRSGKAGIYLNNTGSDNINEIFVWESGEEGILLNNADGLRFSTIRSDFNGHEGIKLINCDQTQLSNVSLINNSTKGAYYAMLTRGGWNMVIDNYMIYKYSGSNQINQISHDELNIVIGNGWIQT